MRKTFLVFIVLIIFSCKSQKLEFEKDDLGILVEKFDSLNKDDNRYNRDNLIYTVGRKFIFNYYYEDKKGNKLLMTKTNSNENNKFDWKFEKLEDKNPFSVSKIMMTISSGLAPFDKWIKGYNQTVMMYEFQMNDGNFWNNEMTGIIENSKNIWVHPPRTDFFKILELNPYPYVQLPLKIGKIWNWKLEFGDQWSDNQWLQWKGKNVNESKYKIAGKTNLKTNLGVLNCYIIEAEAYSNLGNTKLISYFNEKYGFVKLDYTNIDGTKTMVELDEVK